MSWANATSHVYFILYKIQDQESMIQTVVPLKKDTPDFPKNTSALAELNSVSIMADAYKRRPNTIKLRKVKVLIQGSGENKAVNLISGKSYTK